MGLNLKKIKALKVIITTLLVIAFTVSMISCKEAPVAEEQGGEQQEEEKGEVTIPSETKETTPETTVEIEKVDAPEIPGLKFDQKTRTYIAEANNPYGLELGEIAGVFVKDAIEIEGEMKDCVGLDPKIIEYKQNEIFEKTKERKAPFPFNLKEVKNIKVTELVYISGPDAGMILLGIKVPVGSVFCAPFSGTWTMFSPFPDTPTDMCLSTDWDIGLQDQVGISQLYFKEADILVKMKQTDKMYNSVTKKEFPTMEAQVSLGEPFGKITGDTNIEAFAEGGAKDFQIILLLKGKDIKITGVKEIMEVGNSSNSMFVFVLNKENNGY